MASRSDPGQPNPVRWVGSSKEDLSAFPGDVKLRMGYALCEAQMGGEAAYAKPLKGYGDAGVLEVADDFQNDTTGRLYGSLLERRLRAPRFPEEIEAGHRDS